MQQDFVYIFLIVSFVITCIFLLLAYVLSPKELSFEKVSVYECGFEPFGEIVIFNVQFFIVGLLFMILDLEFAFIFP